jgi:hypothetical protein
LLATGNTLVPQPVAARTNGLTFHSPTTWRVSATMAWQTCWAQNGAANQPPNPATCTPVPGAQLNGTTWAPQAVVVNEIQSVNGSPAG